MTDIEMMEKALIIATELHKGQLDKGGNPYILHPISVAKMLETPKQKCVGYLHDTIEDCNIDADFLLNEGFSEEIVNAVITLSKIKGESLNKYKKRVKRNPLAREVKKADLKHNMDISRIPNPTEKDFNRIEKYKEFLKYLEKSS